MTNQFADNTNEFAVQSAQLERRRALAQSLVQQAMQGDGGQGYHGGKVYMVGNQWGNVAKNLGGAALGAMADNDQQNLQVSQNAAQNQWQDQFNTADTPEAKQALLSTARNKGLRYDIEQAALKSEQDQIEKGQQLAADRVEKESNANAQRDFLKSEGELNRQNRLDLKQTPTVQIYQGGGGGKGSSGGGGVANGFAGAAPVIGADDQGNPIYRHTKSGQLFQFDGNGQPSPYAGAVGTKPVADKPMNESQGNAALYGARMGESNKVLEAVGGKYSPMKVDLARSAEKVPGGRQLANTFVLGSNDQKVDQAQRDFINAAMRRESGAAISQGEFDNARKQYFPEQGDQPAVLAQKKANRELVIRGMAEVSGPSGKKAIANITPKAPQATRAITSQAEWQALPPGTPYTMPDGRMGVR